jgi:starch synthase (maltosyl-transferring)
VVLVDADVFTDGHDSLVAELQYRCGKEPEWRRAPMTADKNDRWQSEFTVNDIGEYKFRIIGFIDHFGTWRRDLAKRVTAKQDVAVELLVGADFVHQAIEFAKGSDRERLDEWERRLRTDNPRQYLNEIIAGNELVALVSKWNKPVAVTESATFPVTVDRPLASFSAWYEVFPRSLGREGKPGTLKDVEACLPYVESMGFDVLYLPPIHPIGKVNRKGKNNSVRSQPGEPGSPWAIGSDEGGHKSIHRELGTLDDYKALIAQARKMGIDLAMDIAFQCAPDHPYVTEHPQWFRQRPDGSIQYAENPPKKYQDIYPD